MYISEIRAAISVGQRPTAAILNDAYAGHRKWWNPGYKPTPIMASVWTEWDFILLRVFQYLEDYTTENGHPIWVEEDDDVAWDIDVTTSGYDREMHMYRENNDVKPYQKLRARPIWAEDAEPPSMEKWLKRLEAEEGTGFETLPQGGTPRPPTAEELAKLRNPEP